MQRHLCLLALLVLTTSQIAHAGSATWNLNPVAGNWNSVSDWTPATIPNGPADVATFGVSNTTAVSMSSAVGVSSIVFSPGASAFSISTGANALAISGSGVTNNSGTTQTFTIPAAAASSGSLLFQGGANAADSLIVNNGGMAPGEFGGATIFADTSNAGNATLIANGGTNGGVGGLVRIDDNAVGNNAAVKLFGNGSLDLSLHNDGGLTIGSLEGDGLVFLGDHRLTMGKNRLSTTFTGVIQDGGSNGGTGGAFAKVGSGIFVITGANTYTGATTINGGVYTVNNTSGSGTGTGLVQVNAGTLGGSGIIAGPVTIGMETSDRPHIAPAATGPTPTTLTVQSALTFKSNGGYNCVLKSTGHRATADRVSAKGVTIVSGATFTLLPQVHGTLSVGTAFTVISNTSGNAISGTFSNLPQGAILTAGVNNLQASYSGGDGNDLTLTVVP